MDRIIYMGGGADEFNFSPLAIFGLGDMCGDDSLDFSLAEFHYFVGN